MMQMFEERTFKAEILLVPGSTHRTCRKIRKEALSRWSRVGKEDGGGQPDHIGTRGQLKDLDFAPE